MKCQVSGCQNEANKVLPIAGIFHGTYLTFKVNCCGHHTVDELQRTEERLAERYLSEKFEISCDPMADAKLVTRMRYGAA